MGQRPGSRLAGVAELSVSRWRRYGKDRLYVTGADGSRAGWVCLLSGETVLEQDAYRAAFDAAVAEWRVVNENEDRGSTPETPAAVGEAVECPQSTAWTDLAENEPGKAAREQAVARREAAPVRTFMARLLGVHTDERAWRIGADGEVKVAKRLARLGDAWKVLHAVPLGDRGSDIDHLVIGPGGVYTVNAKHHPGAKIWVAENAFLVNGSRQPYIRNARHEAERASQLLTAACSFPVNVVGLVVPVGADDLVIRKPPSDVVVVNRMRVAKYLSRRPPILDAPTIEAIYAAARRSDTWQPK